MTASTSAPASLASLRRGVEPGVLADQQADRHAARLEHADALAGREVAALVEHLVVGQFALGVGLENAALAEHAGRVVAQLNGDRLAAQAAAGGMADHDHHAVEVRQLGGHGPAPRRRRPTTKAGRRNMSSAA